MSNEGIGSYTLIGWMYQEWGGVGVWGGFMPNEGIGSYRIIGWMYQESAGVRVSIPTMVQDLIESLDRCTKKGEWLRVSCPTSVLDLIHLLGGCVWGG